MTKRRSAARIPGGYTVIELLVAAAVAAILAAISIPAFGSLVRDYRRTVVVNELMTTLMLARSEAMKRRRNVVVCGFDDANGNRELDAGERACSGRDWSDGWAVAVWGDADADGRVDASELDAGLLWQFVNGNPDVTVAAPGFAAANAPEGTAVVRPLGRHSSNGTILVCDRREPVRARAVIVAPNGRSRIEPLDAADAAVRCPRVP